MLSNALLFVGVSMAVICTPGPDTALTIRNTVAGGRRHGVLTGVGVASGQLVWTAAASVGLAGLVQASQPEFEALRLAGGLYLVLLGAQSIWAAWRGRATEAVAHRRPLPVSSRRAARQGLINNLANPKMAAFFLSLLPQFAPAGQVVMSLALGALFCVMTFGWLGLYAVLFDRGRGLFQRAGVRRSLDAASGLVLVGLGVHVATERS